MADETIGEGLDRLGDSARSAKDAFISIRAELNNIKGDLGQSNEYTQDLTKSLLKGSSSSDKLASNIEKIKLSTSSTKTLLSQSAEQIARQKDLTGKVADLSAKAAKATGAQKTSLTLAAKLMGDAAREAGILSEALAEAAKKNVELDKNAQFFDRMGTLAKQIPGLGNMATHFSDAAAAIRKANLDGKEGIEKLSQGVNVLTKVALAEFVRQIFVVNQELTDTQKNLNMSAGEALALKGHFAQVALQSGDVALNSVRIGKANAEMNSQLGTAAVFSGELLGTFSKLTEIVGLSAESAGSLAQQALISGQEFRTVEENALGTSYALQQSSGVALNMRDVLEATGKVTGQVRMNLGANPELIAAAVTKAKLLGMEIQDIANASKHLLDFESSIGAELEAELLTGKQLNLERARALALQGDMVGVADEIAKQNINFSEFGKMNVLQQEALAKAIGMTADGLSDSLITQEAQGRTAKELRSIGKGELADRLEVLSAQESIALAGEKFQAILGSLAAPLAVVAGFFAAIVASSEVVYALMGAIIPLMAIMAAKQAKAFAMSVGNAVANLFGGNAKMGPLGIVAAIAGVGAMMGLIGSAMASSKADDMMYGDNTLITKNKGAIALNNNDTIVAGTNLFGGGGGGGGGISDTQLGKLASAINDKKVSFDPWTASGPSGIVNTERRMGSNLFA